MVDVSPYYSCALPLPLLAINCSNEVSPCFSPNLFFISHYEFRSEGGSFLLSPKASCGWNKNLHYPQVVLWQIPSSKQVLKQNYTLKRDNDACTVSGSKCKNLICLLLLMCGGKKKKEVENGFKVSSLRNYMEKTPSVWNQFLGWAGTKTQFTLQSWDGLTFP